MYTHNERQSRRAQSSRQLKDNTQVASHERDCVSLSVAPLHADTLLTAHGRKHQQAGDDDVPDPGEGLPLEEKVFDDFTADIVLQRDYTRHQHCALYVRRRVVS
jgi:hypothetical protein